jgi:hypothetical protein
MSTYLTRFLEVKNKETGKWELGKCYKKFYKMQVYTKEGWIDNKPDFTVNGRDMSIKPYYDCGNACSLRQYFSDSYANEFTDKDYGLGGRGMPDDISEELKNYLTKEKDYCWNLTYCTLKELIDVMNQEKKLYFEKIKNKIQSNGKDELVARLYHILEEMNKPLENRQKFKAEEKKEEYYEDSLEYLYEEMCWGWESLNDEVTRIQYILDELNNFWEGESNARIIVYFS